MINQAAVGCLRTCFREIKRNKTIEKICIGFGVGDAISVADLHHFFRNNRSLREVSLRADCSHSVETKHISAALLHLPLMKISIDCEFITNSKQFEYALTACQNMEELELIYLFHNHQIGIIAEWLQRPKTLCQKLHLDIYWDEDDPNFDLKTVEHQILSSLAGNTNLKVLEVNLYDSYYTKRAKDLENFQDDDSIKKLLCNTASIESVVQSNHFLQEFKVCEESDDDCEDEESDDDSENEENENETNELQTPLQQYLQLNTNPNKNKVIQAKIMQFYLSGDFEESSIKNMPLSVLAHIMGIDVQEKHSAVFNILRNVPELCSGSSSVVVGEKSYHKKRKHHKET